MLVTTERFAASYSLVRIVGNRGHWTASFFPSLTDLAIGAARAASELVELSSKARSRRVLEHHLRAFGPLRQPFDVIELVAWGCRLLREQRPVAAYFRLAAAAVPGYERRSGPVPGVHRSHSYRWRRSPCTMQERRLNQPAAAQGDPCGRVCRSGLNLPSDRDAGDRGCERSWKSQHKGRKAWDRTDLSAS